MNNLEVMLTKVIRLLEEKLTSVQNPAKINMLLSKYNTALSELKLTGSIKTTLVGGCRAYLDSYSDYLDNPLLDEMYAVEKVLKQPSLQNNEFCR